VMTIARRAPKHAPSGQPGNRFPAKAVKPERGPEAGWQAVEGIALGRAVLWA
jgi:hypothetical protein